eukprot:2504714-Rhodomonas_salina.4
MPSRASAAFSRERDTRPPPAPRELRRSLLPHDPHSRPQTRTASRAEFRRAHCSGLTAACESSGCTRQLTAPSRASRRRVQSDSHAARPRLSSTVCAERWRVTVRDHALTFSTSQRHDRRAQPDASHPHELFCLHSSLCLCAVALICGSPDPSGGTLVLELTGGRQGGRGGSPLWLQRLDCRAEVLDCELQVDPVALSLRKKGHASLAPSAQMTLASNISHHNSHTSHRHSHTSHRNSHTSHTAHQALLQRRSEDLKRRLHPANDPRSARQQNPACRQRLFRRFQAACFAISVCRNVGEFGAGVVGGRGCWGSEGTERYDLCAYGFSLADEESRGRKEWDIGRSGWRDSEIERRMDEEEERMGTEETPRRKDGERTRAAWKKDGETTPGAEPAVWSGLTQIRETGPEHAAVLLEEGGRRVELGGSGGGGERSDRETERQRDTKASDSAPRSREPQLSSSSSHTHTPVELRGAKDNASAAEGSNHLARRRQRLSAAAGGSDTADDVDDDNDDDEEEAEEDEDWRWRMHASTCGRLSESRIEVADCSLRCGCAASVSALGCCSLKDATTTSSRWLCSILLALGPRFRPRSSPAEGEEEEAESSRLL